YEFHRQIRSLRGFFDAHVVQRDDVRMRELADHPGFAQEAVPGFALSDFRRENLDGHRAADQGIEAAHHAAAGADAESFKELVTTELRLHGDLPFSLQNRNGRDCQKWSGSPGGGKLWY